VSGVTYNGVAMTEVTPDILVAEAGSSSIRATVWYILEANLPVAGTYNAVITYVNQGANSHRAATVLSYYDAAQAAPEASQTASTTGAGPSLSAIITTITNNAWVADFFGNSDVRTSTPDSGQAERSDFSFGSTGTHATGDEQIATAGAETHQWTASGTFGRAFLYLIAIAPVAVGGAAQWGGAVSVLTGKPKTI
jgi:hypothetical protein